MSKPFIRREQIFQYIQENYQVFPEYLWEKYPNYAVFKHHHNQKWFGFVADLPCKKLGIAENDQYGSIMDILVIKADPAAIPTLLHNKGYLPAYYMNKSHWISICLDGSVDADEIWFLLNESYKLTQK